MTYRRSIGARFLSSVMSFYMVIGQVYYPVAMAQAPVSQGDSNAVAPSSASASSGSINQPIDTQCMQDKANLGTLNCSANDVKVSKLNVLNGVTSCIAGQTVSVDLQAVAAATSSMRYDVGIFVAKDGGNALTGSCWQSYLSPIASCGSSTYDPNSGVGPFYNAECSADPGDACGDIKTDATRMNLGTLDVVCKDSNNDGIADVTACLSWDTTASNGGSKPSCTGVNDTLPSNKSKCGCASVAIGNVVVLGKIIVNNVTVGPDSTFSYTADYANFSLSNGGQNQSQGLMAGVYNIQQLPQAGYSTSVSCSDPSGGTVTGNSSASVNLAQGEIVSCTFTNTRLSSITIQEKSLPSDAQDFLYATQGLTNFSLDDDADATLPSMKVFSNLQPGSYAIGQAAQTGWDLTGLSCVDPNGQTTVDLATGTAHINLAAGVDVSCTYTNTKRGRIIVEKQTDPDGAQGSFAFSGTASGTIQDNGQIAVDNLKPGVYTSTEADYAPNYQLASIVCDDSASATPSAGNLQTRTATFNVDPGETVKCVFTNKQQQGSIVLKKVTQGGDGTFVFNSNTLPVAPLTTQNGTAQQTFLNLPVGTYDLSEAVPSGWDLMSAACSDGSPIGAISLQSNEAVTCTFTNVKQMPAVALSMNAAVALGVGDPTRADVGDHVNYTLDVSNTGNVALSVPLVQAQATNSACDGLPTYASGDVNQNGKLDLTEVWAYSCSHTLTQSDIDAGVVNSTGATNMMAPDGSIVSASQALSTPIIAAPQINVALSADQASATHAGQVINYTARVTNPGNVTLKTVAVQGDKCTMVYQSGDSNSDGLLNLGESWEYACPYTVTQADIDGGQDLSSTVSASANPPAGSPVSDSDTLKISVNANKSIALSGVGTLNMTAVAPADRADVGDAVAYTLDATNTGSVTLSNVQMSNSACDGAPSLVSGDINTNNLMDPGEIWHYTCQHLLTQADIDAGVVNSAAAVTALANGSPVNANTDISTNIAASPQLQAALSSDQNQVTQAGQVILYTATFTNAGNATLTNLVVQSDKCTLNYVSGDSNLDGLLSVGETWTYTCAYTVSQADVDAGGTVNNHVAANAQTTKGQPASANADLSLAVAQHPSVALQNTALLGLSVGDPARADVGDHINYTLNVSNTGNVTLSVPLAVDQVTNSACSTTPVFLSGDTNQNGKLDLTEVWAYSCDHVLTQSDIDAGLVNSTGTTNMMAPDGSIVSASQAAATTLAAAAQINVALSADQASATHAGQVINYTATVSNPGNVTLKTVAVQGDKCTMVYQSGDSNSDGLLNVGEAWTYTCAYTVTQADIDAGNAIGHTVDASANAPAGQQVVDTDVLDINVNASKSISLGGTGALNMAVIAPADRADVGDYITYVLQATNTGAATLSNVQMSNSACNAAPTLLSGDTNANNLMEPGEIWSYSCQHLLTQADIDAGVVNSDAAVAALAGSTAVNATTQIPVNVPVVGQMQVAVSADQSQVTGQGQVIVYTTTVTNTGNATLNGVQVQGDKCTPVYQSGDANLDGLLSVGEIWTYTCSYTVSQADVDAGGSVDNHASADAQTQTGQAVTASGDSSLGVTQHPSVTLQNSAALDMSVGDPARADVGDLITYTLNVHNDGSVTLHNVALTNDVCDANSQPHLVSGDSNSNGLLDVGETFVYTCVHTLTQADLDQGQVISHAKVDATSPADVVVSANADASVNNLKKPLIAVSVAADLAQVSQAGQIVNYTMTVTNPGNTALHGVFVTATNCTNIAYVSGDVNNNQMMDVGEALTFTCSHTVTQAEIDQNGSPSAGTGKLLNVVTAHSQEGVTADAQKEIALVLSPGVSLSVSANVASLAAPQQVVYTYDVTNTGNVSLSGLVVTASNVSFVVNCPVALAVGQSGQCTAAHTFTQSELNANGSPAGSGFLVETASVSTAQGASAGPVATSIPVVQNPQIKVTQTSSTDSVDHVGQVITYNINVSNIGNIDLSGITVSSSDCDGPATYVSGDNGDGILQLTENWVYTCQRTIVQDDFNQGDITNTTTVDSSESEPSSSTTTVTVTELPKVTFQEVLGPKEDKDNSGTISLGDSLSFIFIVTNTGNVPLTGIAVTENQFGTITCPKTSLQPGEVMQCQASLSVNAGHVAAGTINSASALTTDQLPKVTSGVKVSVANVCGDGIKSQSEQCEDGNTANGDGCSSTCKLEVKVVDPGCSCDATGQNGASGSNWMLMLSGLILMGVWRQSSNSRRRKHIAR